MYLTISRYSVVNHILSNGYWPLLASSQNFLLQLDFLP
jgi:hypothetical protein